MRVIFAGTPEFAATALDAILQAGIEVPLVLTQPDRPAGRGMQLQASAVKQLALKHNIPVAQPVSLRLDGKYPEVASEAHALLKATAHDVMVVAAYGLILPLSVLSIPRLGCLNIHGSLLPRWRGAAPIHRAIEAGDTETGITIMQMEEGLDTGPMLSRQAMPIEKHDTTASLHDKLAALGGEMIVSTLRTLAQQNLVGEKQNDALANYASKISKEEAALDFNLSAEALDRKIRAFNPFPAAQAKLNDVALKIWKAEVSTIHAGQFQSGEVVKVEADSLILACDHGRSFLRLTELQKPGGKRLAVHDFLQGFPITAGAILR